MLFLEVDAGNYHYSYLKDDKKLTVVKVLNLFHYYFPTKLTFGLLFGTITTKKSIEKDTKMLTSSLIAFI